MTDGLGTFYVLTTLDGESFDLPESQGGMAEMAMDDSSLSLTLVTFRGRLKIHGSEIGSLLLSTEQDRERERSRAGRQRRAWEASEDNEPWRRD